MTLPGLFLAMCQPIALLVVSVHPCILWRFQRGDSHDEGCSSDSEVDDAGEEEEILLKHTDIQCQTGRRTTLPSPRPPADGSLLKMIGGFIGKDLTRLALPVKINEPLSMLQVCLIYRI